MSGQRQYHSGVVLRQEAGAEKTGTGTYSGIACDMRGIITSYGVGAQHIFGYKPEEVIGKQSVAIFHLPENVEKLVPRLLKTAAETGKFEEEVILLRKNGTKFRAILTVRPLKRGNEIVGYMGLTKPLRDL